MSEVGKLIVGKDEFDVYICNICGEHEGQVEVCGDLLCYTCYLELSNTETDEYNDYVDERCENISTREFDEEE